MEPERVSRDGLPIWSAPAPGPFVAALQFRVGQADEPLHMTGITHLVEHLVMSAAGRREHLHNAYVDATSCVFFAEGERAEVLEYLGLIGAAITARQTDKLELERRILRVEAAQHAPDVVARLLAMRFGLAGFGLLAERELGLRWVGEEEVRAWWAAHFTRGNAALWMTGDPPAELGFELPAGPRVPPPEPAPLPAALPAFVADGTGGVAVSGLAPRTPALACAASIAGERLYARLRHEHGVAYAPYHDYRPLGHATAHVVLGSDGRDEDAGRLLGELWECVSDLAEDGAREEELDQARRFVERERRKPETVANDLAFAADSELAGRPHMTLDELAAARAAVDPAAVGAAMRDVLASAILLGPEGSRPVAGLRSLDVPAAAPLEGQRFVRPRPGRLKRRPDEELWIGERHLGWRDAEDRMTIAWEDVAAAEMRPDGGLRLVARDGRWFAVLPYQWEDGARAVSLARARVPGDMMIPAGDAALCAAIERAVARRVREVAAVAPPLEVLPDELSPDESVVDLAVATRTRGFVVGLLVLTERRLLWLASLSDERLALAREEVSSAQAHGAELRLAWDGGEAKFVIDPKAAAAEIVEAI